MAQFMIDMMVMMMPYMKPVAYVGGVGAALGLLLTVAHAITGGGGGLGALAAKLTLAVGIFFVACEAAGRMLSMQPTLLFSADPFEREMYRNQWPFWAIGLGLIVAGLILQRLGARQHQA